MSITAISSASSTRTPAAPRGRRKKGPVIITDRGRPSHVLLSFEDYRRLAGAGRSLLDIVVQDDDDIDFDPPLMVDSIFRPADFD